MTATDPPGPTPADERGPTPADPPGPTPADRRPGAPADRRPGAPEDRRAGTPVHPSGWSPQDTDIPPASPGAPWDLVLLDRDGTLNAHRPGYISSPDDLVLLPGAAAAVASLNRAGVRVVLVTNQQGLGTGALALADFARVQDRLALLLGEAGAHLDGVEVCPHRAGTCGCRKPAPGLIQHARRRAGWASPDRIVLVGDQPSDAAAAAAAGVRGILLGREAPSLAGWVERTLYPAPTAP